MTRKPDPFGDTSRRTFLKTAAATGALVGVGATAAQETTTQETTQPTSYEFDAAIGGWFGSAPAAIEGEQNPTLELQAGQTYTVTWTNADGFRHNFVVLNAAGDEVVRSEIISEQGATQTVEFEATEGMTEYFCEIHPGSMRGDLEVTGRDEATPSQATEIAPPGPEVGLQTVAEGLTAPLGFETAPGVDDRQFVLDQTGQVYVLGPDGLQEEPFLDVSDRMVDLGIEELNGYDERGLLGLAFHPDFTENRRLFVRYSAPLRGSPGGGPGETATGTTSAGTGTGAGTESAGMGAGAQETTEGTTAAGTETETETPGGKSGGPTGQYDHTDVLAEFRAAEDLNSVDPGSERAVMEIPSPQDNHNGGALAFGPDGYLYSSIGDGGDADDTGFGHVDDWYDRNAGGNGQDVEQNLLGSVLRIDVDVQDGATTTTGATGTTTTAGTTAAGGGDRAYGIPDDNPFADGGEGLPEHYAWGFRNPWRMSFNDGELFVGDAGQNRWEEVDIVENGGNYGWNVREGAHCFSTEDPTRVPEQCPTSTPDDVRGGEELVDPIIEYPHRQQTTAFIDGSVVIGGYVYGSDTVAELRDTYLFGNWSASGVVNPEGEIFAATRPGGDGTTGTETETTAAGGETARTTVAAPAEAEGEVGRYGGTWSYEKLVIAGTEDGRLDRYVYAFGRDQNGDVYVLTNANFRPEGDTGMVHRIVPPGEGDYGETAATTETETEGADAGGTETETEEAETGTGGATTETTPGGS